MTTNGPIEAPSPIVAVAARPAAHHPDAAQIDGLQFGSSGVRDRSGVAQHIRGVSVSFGTVDRDDLRCSGHGFSSSTNGCANDLDRR